MPSASPAQVRLGRFDLDDVAVVSASDKLHNARTIVADLRRDGVEYLDRFSAGRDSIPWYYPALVEAYRGSPAHPKALGDELARVVSEMDHLATGARE